MILEIVLLLVGLALVLFGADWLVDGASAIARRSGISEFIIGMTIVGFGTSCPELVVSMTGAIQGNPDIAVGNVIGSNIFNTLLILGVTALICPIAVSSENRKVDIPMMLGVSLLLVGLGFNGLSRLDAIIFLVLFAAYLYFCFKIAPREEYTEEDGKKTIKPLAAVALCIIGIAGLVFGGRLFVDNSVLLAKALNLSDKFIAITLLASGTSLPELVTSVVAATKGKDKLALGNIIGSNIFNILFILGCAACVTPLSFASISFVDLSALVASALLLMLSVMLYDKFKIKRAEGAVFLLAFAAYYIWLFLNG